MKYLISFIILCFFYPPIFAQLGSSSNSDSNSNLTISNASADQSNSNNLIKSLSPIKAVPSNKFETKTLSKVSTEKKPLYSKKAEIEKIQTYIRKIELHIEKSEVNHDSNLEIKELKVLLKKLNTKLSALK